MAKYVCTCGMGYCEFNLSTDDFVPKDVMDEFKNGCPIHMDTVCHIELERPEAYGYDKNGNQVKSCKNCFWNKNPDESDPIEVMCSKHQSTHKSYDYCPGWAEYEPHMSDEHSD